MELLFLVLVMVVWTGIAFGAVFLDVFAWSNLVDEWMILELFPAMAKLAVIAIGAPFLIVEHNLIAVPIRTDLWHYVVFVRLPPEILPVMGVHAQPTVMVDMVYWAKCCLEMEYKESRVVFI
jgi:hypothetical protein